MAAEMGAGCGMLMKIPLLIPKGGNFLKAAANNRPLSGLLAGWLI